MRASQRKEMRDNSREEFKSLFRLLRLVARFWGYVIIASVLTLGYNLINLAQPLLFKSLFETIFETKSMTQLNTLIGLALILYISKAGLQYGQIYLLNYINAKVVMEIQNSLHYKLLRLRMSRFDRGSSGDFFSRMFNDVSMLSNELSTVMMNTLNSVITLLGAVIWITWKNWSLALLTFTVVPLIGLLVKESSKRMGKATSRYQEELAHLSSILSETLSGIRTLKAFAKERAEHERFKSRNEELLLKRLSMIKVMAAHRPLAELTASLGIIMISWYGGYLVLKGSMTPGDILAYWGYVAISVTPATILSTSIVDWKRLVAAVSRVFTILDEDDEESGGYISAESINGELEFRDVWLSYDESDSYELKGISFKVKPSERVALVGPTGAGKSSILSLLLRFYEPTRGEILLDGRNLRDYELSSLRRAIGVVLQEPFIFRASVRDNIAYANPNADMDEIIEAAKKAQIHDEIMKLPMGYDTVIGERGATLSGGQRQRLAIARLFLIQPRIILLDEPTSALDLDTEERLQRALMELMRDRTVIVVTHRPSLLRYVDRILIIADGELLLELKPEEVGDLQEVIRQVMRGRFSTYSQRRSEVT